MSVQSSPGPWADHADLTVRDRFGVVLARCAGTIGKYELEAANARLIAAAPVLLDLARRVAECDIWEAEDIAREARSAVYIAVRSGS